MPATLANSWRAARVAQRVCVAYDKRARVQLQLHDDDDDDDDNDGDNNNEQESHDSRAIKTRATLVDYNAHDDNNVPLIMLVLRSDRTRAHIYISAECTRAL